MSNLTKNSARQRVKTYEPEITGKIIEGPMNEFKQSLISIPAISEEKEERICIFDALVLTSVVAQGFSKQQEIVL